MGRALNDRMPAYTRKKRLSGNVYAYYWELPHWAKPTKDAATGKMVPATRHDRQCPVASEPLGSDKGIAYQKAEALNATLTEWRTADPAKGLAVGTVAWLFDWYRKQERFTSKAAKTRKDYRKLMDMLVQLETKKGAPHFGTRRASDVDGPVADKIYKVLKPRGVRQASYAMQVCRLVWSWALRHHRVTGVKENPFLGMGLVSKAKKGNRGTTRAEYDLYRATARAMGFQSMATAAALAFEGCQRTWDAFGYEDPDGVKQRGFLWEDYTDETISLVQSKTGTRVTLPLAIKGADGERLSLYPDLEEEIARSREMQRDGVDVIVVEERSGEKYKERRMSSVHRQICEKAGLPKEMTFTGFRHGGITEVGSVTADVRPISGHATLDVTRIYNKVTEDKAREIASARRAHVLLIAGTTEPDGESE
ncbi:site-specific integrase [Sphingomonas abietis]|uniref:Tyr recombinase domain-containing protein n=1 Tax=Sphingomonas abietis TaxID=3012344 RepID=A0ABY7NTJ5_9SPHN|nr:hypothetical protein [Sphingomonas abietis]WBO23983.1 hypothetical protein PBT88_07690 [Sphingomonas abietis]